MVQQTMQIRLYRLVPLLTSILVACTNAGVKAIDPAPGYGLRAVSISPKPETTFSVGQQVTFSVTVEYHLELADSGMVLLIPQDQSGGSLVVGRGQVTRSVERGSGQVTLSDSVTVPPGARNVQLFILLVPAGHTQASGQLFVKFPVR